MRHGFRKLKFVKGQDANQMLVRKLAMNFFLKGKLSTTLAKIKAIKPIVENTVTKSMSGKESDKNVLLRKYGSHKLSLDLVLAEAVIQLKGIKGGYTKIIKNGTRDSDGAETGTLVWAHPVKKEIKTKVESKKEV